MLTVKGSNMTTTAEAFGTLHATVGGHDFATTATFPVINPAMGAVFAHAPAVTPAQLDIVFDSAQTAFATWKLDDDVRREYLHKVADAIESSVDRLAPTITAEVGRPLPRARDEILRSALWVRYYADLEVSRDVVRDDAQRYEEVVRRPMGVVSAIAPWNFPLLLAIWKIAPALRAGNTVVVKPSPYTPLSTLALGELLRGILPDGVFNVVTGPEPLGAAMVSHPVPRKVSFTGSTGVGKAIARLAADDLKRVTLELGGNDPAIVLDDADVERTAAGLFASGFANCGQVCVAVKRVYAHERIHAQLVEALGDLARAATVGDGMAEGIQMGPVNNKPQFDRVTELVSDAVHNGARVVAGGGALPRDGYFFAPTILDSVRDGIRVVDEEQFGPVLPVMSFTDENEALARANRGHFGLSASVWSSDEGRAVQLTSKIDSGTVVVNAHGGGFAPHLPFGGYKWSGIGLENGRWGLDSYTDFQTLAVMR